KMECCLPHVVCRRSRRRSRPIATGGPKCQLTRDSSNLPADCSGDRCCTETAGMARASMTRIVVDFTIPNDEKLSQPTEQAQSPRREHATNRNARMVLPLRSGRIFCLTMARRTAGTFSRTALTEPLYHSEPISGEQLLDDPRVAIARSLDASFEDGTIADD